MNSVIHNLQMTDLQENAQLCTTKCLQALETGKVVFLPNEAPPVDRSMRGQLEASILDGRHKNVSFDQQRQRLGGVNHALKGTEQEQFLYDFMQQWFHYAHDLLKRVFPFYQQSIIPGRSSYRPAQIAGRALSKRKDDTRLHVDAFPASPVNGKRILRLFSNINFDNQPRHWHIGEPFADVLKRFYPDMSPWRKSIAQLMYWLKATKTPRSAYDHVMLQLHDRMKLSDTYQASVAKTEVQFPAMSSWFVFTDQVSHAALGGQYLLEQTFYLPVEAMAQPEQSPLLQIEASAKQNSLSAAC